MIVSVTLPVGATGVRYGKIEMLGDDDRKMDVPNYLAKAIMALPGAVGMPEMQTTAQLIAGTEDEFELNYLFLAHGRQIPFDKFEPELVDQDGEQVPTGKMTLVEAANIKAKAAELLAQRGEPVAALI